jgi:3'-phosphoadenosine 5'-phosphosulfate sulfotransferase (PAPS reductase)/FAD synthetase
MDELERRKFELHSKESDYKSRIQKAGDNIEYIFDNFESPVINYSGGKDSLVLLHLVSQRCGYQNVPVYHFDNGLLKVPGSVDFVKNSVERIGGDLFVRSSEKANSEDMILEEGHGYSGFFGWYNTLSKREGWDIRVLGIRADESNERRDRYDSENPVNYDEYYTSSAPIHHLTTRDIWSYIVSNGLEYHSIYDEQAKLYDTIEHPRNRLVTLYDSEFENLGSKEISMFLYPNKSSKLKDIEKSNRSK